MGLEEILFFEIIKMSNGRFARVRKRIANTAKSIGDWKVIEDPKVPTGKAIETIKRFTHGEISHEEMLKEFARQRQNRDVAAVITTIGAIPLLLAGTYLYLKYVPPKPNSFDNRPLLEQWSDPEPLTTPIPKVLPPEG